MSPQALSVFPRELARLNNIVIHSLTAHQIGGSGGILATPNIHTLDNRKSNKSFQSGKDSCSKSRLSPAGTREVSD